MKLFMKRSYLEKHYFKKKTTESLKKYKKHKNKCCGLYKKERKRYLDILHANKIIDKKDFLKNIQPLIFDKRKLANKITLEDSEENILPDDTLVLDELNNSKARVL